MKAIDFGCIHPPIKAPDAERYLALFNAIEQLIDKYNPDFVAVESQFVYKNAQSALKLGRAQGMALVVAARRNIPIYEFAPKKAKRAVVGVGSASKQQVQKMIQILLQLPCLPEPEDAADALALAICLSHQLRCCYV
jgi:crossover junction endodeoxyribonuclease RuvC